uniref:Uncharacterized protein n=1 Tax=Xenopus tropicalis TaxID=8364 RepID=A0A1B8Y1W2_XENTR
MQMVAFKVSSPRQGHSIGDMSFPYCSAQRLHLAPPPAQTSLSCCQSPSRLRRL